MNYYNENDEKTAAWLRELIACGLVAPGEVDTRSIEDVRPGDLAGYAQCHFFAGIGVWSYALRNAGWPDDRAVWTGSCPCQPFSAAGQGNGFADERHLWPAWFQLIAQCRPDVIYGEQVASKDGLAWLDLVHADMEAAGYAVGAVDLCAAGVGAPHIRQRLWFVADAERRAPERQRLDLGGAASSAGRGAWEQRVRADVGAGGVAVVLAHAEHGGRSVGKPERPGPSAVVPSSHAVVLGDTQRQGREGGQPDHVPGAGRRCEGGLAEQPGGVAAGELADHDGDGRGRGGEARLHERRPGAGGDEPTQGGPDGPRGDDADRRGAVDRPGPTGGFWAAADWIYCRDNKYRPLEPGSSALAHESPARVVRLRGYGNAICAEAAQAFIESTL